VIPACAGIKKGAKRPRGGGLLGVRGRPAG